LEKYTQIIYYFFKKTDIYIYIHTHARRPGKPGPTPDLMNQRPALGPAMPGPSACPFLKFNGAETTRRPP
jgi:hypothetical protein